MVQNRSGGAGQIIGHFLIGKVDLGLDQGQGLQQVPAKSGVGIAEGAVQLAQSLRLLGGRLGVDQIGDSLGLGQVHAAVLEGATGELARFGGANV
ncbi:hypothetical protein D3C71_1495960 [compost metagenome]